VAQFLARNCGPHVANASPIEEPGAIADLLAKTSGRARQVDDQQPPVDPVRGVRQVLTSFTSSL